MKLVLCCGVFDLFHVAHLRHLQEARTFGTMLAVGVTSDAGVGKGAGRPVIPELERLEMVRGCGAVGAVIICRDSLESLDIYRPQVFCKGHDYLEKGLLPLEIEFCAEHNIEIVHTKPNPQTTSAIIERIKNG